MICESFNLSQMRDTLAVAEMKAAAVAEMKTAAARERRAKNQQRRKGSVGETMYVPPKQVLQYLVRYGVSLHIIFCSNSAHYIFPYRFPVNLYSGKR